MRDRQTDRDRDVDRDRDREGVRDRQTDRDVDRDREGVRDRQTDRRRRRGRRRTSGTMSDLYNFTMINSSCLVIFPSLTDDSRLKHIKASVHSITTHRVNL